MKYLFIEGDIEKYKKEIKDIRHEQFIRLYEQCKLYFEEKLPESPPPRSTTFMGMAILNLSFMYLLTRQKQYLEEAKRWIFTSVKYEHWGNAHLVDVDLSASWILFGMSISYNWLKEDLTSYERKKIVEKLILQAEKMYVFKKSTEGKGWPTSFWQNHNWINLTGLAACGYALKDIYAGAQKWIEVAKENFKIVYDVLPEDGSDYEGVVYWRYGVFWLLAYAHLLKVEEGIDYFKSCSFLKNTFYYRLYQAVPNLQETINYGDCHDRRSAHSIAMYYKFAHEYKNGYAQFLASKVKKFIFREQYESDIKPGILPEAVFEILWYDPEVQEKNFNDLPLIKYFEDLGLVVIRDSWKEDATIFSFKCGAPGGKQQWEKSYELLKEKGLITRGLSHQHPDNNSFIIHSNGAYLAIDDGYDRTVKACDHNVIVVDDKGYSDEGKNNVWEKTLQNDVGEIKAFHNEGNFVYILGETSKSYQKDLNLNWFGRNVFYTGKNYFVIVDDVESTKMHKYSWIMHSDVYPEEIEKGVFEYKNGPAKMRLYNLNREKVSITYRDTHVKSIMTTQEPDKFREINMKSIVIENNEPLNKMKFINIITPTSIFNDYDIQIEKIIESGIIGCKIKSSKWKEKFIFNTGSGIDYKEIKSDALWIYLVYENNKVKYIDAFGGEYISYKSSKYNIKHGRVQVIKLC
mgnify:CR=1 FL=1